MRDQRIIKLFLALVLSTAYIFSFAHFGSLAYSNFVGDDSIYEPNTRLGPLDLSGKTADEAGIMLEESIASWYENTELEFTYKEAALKMKPTKVKFLIEDTIASIQSGQENTVLVKLDEETLLAMVYDTSSSLKSEMVDMKSLSAEFLTRAAALESGTYLYRLEKYVDDPEGEQIFISKAVIETGSDSGGVDAIVKQIPTLELKGQTQTSLLQTIGKAGGGSYGTESLSMIATAIYETILPTNFTVIERHISRELPDYAKLGYEAKVSEEQNMDFVFSNTNDADYTMELTMSGTELTVILKGTSFLNKYSIVAEDEKSFQPATVKQYNAQIPTGQIKIQQEGQEGHIIKLYRKVFNENGEQTKNELIAEDFYAPIPKIEVHSLIVPQVETIPEDNPPSEGDQTGTGNPDGEQGDDPAGEPVADPDSPGNEPGGVNEKPETSPGSKEDELPEEDIK